MSELVSAFNSSLETGVRSLYILSNAYPHHFDLQRLVELDYLVVHSGDVGGPESLHAPLPLRAGELLIRREIVENGLILMASRGLVERMPTETGIVYRAAERAAAYVAALQEAYSLNLGDRARWVVDNFGHMPATEIRNITRGFFERWSSDFQSSQTQRDLL